VGDYLEEGTGNGFNGRVISVVVPGRGREMMVVGPNALELHLLRHCLTMFVAQVAVSFHCQSAAVFVSKPT